MFQLGCGSKETSVQLVLEVILVPEIHAIGSMKPKPPEVNDNVSSTVALALWVAMQCLLY